MDIAKRVPAEEYLKLNLSAYNNADWQKAFNFLEARLNQRFIEPADKLIELEKGVPAYDKKFGFAVLAIDCLLTETIQSFYEGVTDSTGKSKQLFVNFLTNRVHFKNYFNQTQAEEFYKNFRCGILHQAQTSSDTKVWAVGDLIRRTGKFVTVNRELYHDKIKQELTDYLFLLRSKSDTTLLKNFKDKMDFIAQ